MNIIGDKVILRAIEERDNEILHEMINSPQMERATMGWAFPVSIHGQAQWLKNHTSSPIPNAIKCIVETIEGKQAIGLMSLTDIDYKNGTAQSSGKISMGTQGKGYGADAHKAMFRYAFDELRLNCIYAQILEDNEASLKMCDRMGFKREGILRQRVYKQGKYLNAVSLSLLKDEFIDS